MLAPIESVEVIVGQSSPPQYIARVISGLPGGCARFEEITTERDGETVRITVWNTMPAVGESVVCTMIYGYAEHDIALGSDFTSQQRYTVEVNDVTETFVAQ